MAAFASLDLLRPGGPISRRLPEYEQRPEQLAMAASIEHAFASDEHLIVEAGTGVGKSFAYLIPAVLKATGGGKLDKPVVISTGTIALQEQLMGKDIPFLRSVWDREFTAVLAKGRSNYISLRRMQLALERQATSGQLFPGTEKMQLARIGEWSESTEDGSRADLGFTPDPSVWEQVVSDSHNCMGKRCPTYEKCFYQKARRRVFSAHVLVVNHALLFADMALKMSGVSFLPDYQYLILDEAHDIERIASNHLGIHISRGAIDHLLNTVDNPRGGRGLSHNWPQHSLQLFESAERCRHAAREYVDRMATFLQRSREPKVRVYEPNLFPPDLADALRDMHFKLVKIADGADEAPGASADDPKRGDMRLEFEAAARRALAMADSIEAFNTQSLPGQVYWVERGESRRQDNFEIHAAPVHVGTVLRESMFDGTKSVILTSATLATGTASRAATGGGAFAYLRDRLGLDRVRGGEDILAHALAAAHSALAAPPLVEAPISAKAVSATATESSATPKDEIPSASELAEAMGWNEGAPSDGEPTQPTIPLGRFESVGHDVKVRELLLGSPFDYEKQAVLRLPAMPEPNDPGYDDALAEAVMEAIRLSRGGTFVLFTSYQQMQRTYRSIGPELQFSGHAVFLHGELPRSQMLEGFRNAKKGVLFGTETFWQGVDVPGDALTSVVITRLPFAVPTEPLVAARIEAIDRQGGNAFMEYQVPQAIIKLKQGFGRLIRRATDTGTVTILDSRLRSKGYGKAFLAALPKARVVLD